MLSRKERPTILLAAAPDSIRMLCPALEDEFNAISCATMYEAQSALHADIDLILCCSHFDNCRMFDLLGYCKSSPKLGDTPFLCLRLLGGELDDTAYEAVEIASSALGAVGFLDLYRMKSRLGDAEADQTLRQHIRLHAKGENQI